MHSIQTICQKKTNDISNSYWSIWRKTLETYKAPLSNKCVNLSEKWCVNKNVAIGIFSAHRQWIRLYARRYSDISGLRSRALWNVIKQHCIQLQACAFGTTEICICKWPVPPRTLKRNNVNSVVIYRSFLLLYYCFFTFHSGIIT